MIKDIYPLSQLNLVWSLIRDIAANDTSSQSDDNVENLPPDTDTSTLMADDLSQHGNPDPLPAATVPSTGSSETESGEERWSWDRIDNHVPLSSSGSDDDVVQCDLTFSGKLSEWCVNGGVPHTQMDSLLKILREHGHQELPLTTRTLLGTTAKVTVEEKSGMTYFSLGTVSQLQKHLADYPLDFLKTLPGIDISLNIDGLQCLKGK